MSLRQALEKLRNDIGKEAKENHLTDVCYMLSLWWFSFCHDMQKYLIHGALFNVVLVGKRTAFAG